jgi:hypothetical protein
MANRSAILDLSAIALSGAEVIEMLSPRTAGLPKRIATKPLALDEHDDAAIDPLKWSVTGVVNEQAFLGVNGLRVTGPAIPAFDSAGVIYKPAILASVGKMVLARAIMDHPSEFIFALQEYDFTVDIPLAPTTWTLKHLVFPQDLRNSMGLRVSPGALYWFEGGASGTEEFVAALPSKMSKVGEVYPIQVAFVFTATGWDIWAHLPGIWSEPSLVKRYVRPSSTHNTWGYSFCTNVRTADDYLHFYNLANYFRSNAMVTGARIVTSNLQDTVPVGSILLTTEDGFNASQPGTIRVRVPDYSAGLLTLAQLAEVVWGLSGKNTYEVQIEMSGDTSVLHPIRATVDDVTLPVTPTATPA